MRYRRWLDLAGADRRGREPYMAGDSSRLGQVASRWLGTAPR